MLRSPDSAGDAPVRPGLSARGSALWMLPLFLVFLPIVLLGFYAQSIATNSVSHLIEAQNIALTENVSRLLTEEMTKTLTLAEALAALPGTASALSKRDDFTLASRLKALILAVPELRRGFVLDAKGSVRGGYPLGRAVDIQRAALDAWFAGQDDARGGVVGGVAVAETASGALVVPVVAPVIDNGATKGYVVLEYRAEEIARWLTTIELPSRGALLILDADGAVVAASQMRQLAVVVGDYASVPEVRQALRGRGQTAQYDDPLNGRRMIASFLPVTVAGRAWVVVAQQPTDVAFAQLRDVRAKIAIAAGLLTCITLAMIVMLARFSARNMRLNRELETRNQTLREVASIVESSNDAIIGTLADGTIHSWNAAAQQMYGYDAAEVIGRSIQLLLPQDRQGEWREMQGQIQAGQQVVSMETVRRRKDGSDLPVAVTLSPVRDAMGDTVGLSSIDRDITERRKIEQMKSDFVSFVSHQLKAPITAMKWILESIHDGDDGPVPPAMQSSVAQLQESTAQCANLIGDILNASRIERGVIAVELKPVALAELVERAVKDYRISCERAGIRLVLRGTEQDIVVMIDKEKCAEAVSNSVSNAIKHTPKGGTITVSMCADDANGIVEVSDDGEGMPPDVVTKLFKRTSIIGSAASPERSAGLGLYIAKSFMELQQGSIEVASVLGEGTTFRYRMVLATNQPNIAK